MKPAWTWLVLAALAPLAPVRAQPTGAPQSSEEPPEEILVIGRQPGPPLWKVTSGDHVLWIFPQLSPVPKGMIWDSAKVAAVIAEADEVLELPSLSAGVPLGVRLNPLNLFRASRLAKRVSANPDGATLKATIPPDLYSRYVALKAKYFPRDDDLDALRPVWAAMQMSETVLDKEGLGAGREIGSTLQRAIRRNRDIKQTPITLKVELEGNYREIADRVETLAASIDPNTELRCFQDTVDKLEHDLGNMKSRANAWASGHIDEFRRLPAQRGDEDPCFAVLSGSSEGGNLASATAELESRWVEEAERALRDNASTFAILTIGYLLRPDGPIARLREHGYEVREP